MDFESGEYAVITGASAGMGLQFAKELAERGLNLILIARRKEKLEVLRDQLVAQYSINAENYVADLSNLNEIEGLVLYLQKYEDISLLINAAGFGTLGKFTSLESTKLQALHHVHTTAPILLSHAVLPTMVKHHKGAIINISSMEIYRVPRLGIVYTAAKQFVATFSKGLAKQMRKQGVNVQLIIPGYTRTEFHKVGDYVGKRPFQKPAFMWITPQKIVHASLRQLGKKRVVLIPGWFNKLLWGVLHFPGLGSLIRFLS